MKELKEYIRKTLAHRHLGRAMVGAVALNTVRTFLRSQKSMSSKVESHIHKQPHQKSGFIDSGFSEPSTEIEGYVSFNVFFLKTNDQTLKIQIFKQKNQIIEQVNLALDRVGYTTKVVEIRIKT